MSRKNNNLLKYAYQNMSVSAFEYHSLLIGCFGVLVSCIVFCIASAHDGFQQCFERLVLCAMRHSGFCAEWNSFIYIAKSRITVIEIEKKKVLSEVRIWYSLTIKFLYLSVRLLNYVTGTYKWNFMGRKGETDVLEYSISLGWYVSGWMIL